MTEADILAMTYTDKVAVYRPFKQLLASGETMFKKWRDGQKRYENISCAFSSHQGGQLRQSDSTASAETQYSLFTRPEIEIQENDFLSIIHRGKTYLMIAGTPDRQISHNNIPLHPAKEMV